MSGEIQPMPGQIDVRWDLMSHQSDYSLIDFWCILKHLESESVYASELDFDGVGRSSETIHSWWMLSEGLLTPSKPALNLILHGVRRTPSTNYVWSRKTFWDHP